MATVANELERAVYDILENDVIATRLDVDCMRVVTSVAGNTDVVRVEIVFYRDITGDTSHD